MRTIRAIGCTRIAEDHRHGVRRTAVCILLDAAHARHTIRAFRRDQHPDSVVHPLPATEATRLLALHPDRPEEVEDCAELAVAS